MKCCKTCRFLHVPLDAAGRRRVGKYSGYECHAPMPDIPVDIPESIRVIIGHRTRMCGDDGEKCGAYRPV